MFHPPSEKDKVKIGWLRMVRGGIELATFVGPPTLPKPKVVLRFLLKEVHAGRKITLRLASGLRQRNQGGIPNVAIGVVESANQETYALRISNLPNAVHCTGSNRPKSRRTQGLEHVQCFRITYLTQLWTDDKEC